MTVRTMVAKRQGLKHSDVPLSAQAWEVKRVTTHIQKASNRRLDAYDVCAKVCDTPRQGETQRRTADNCMHADRKHQIGCNMRWPQLVSPWSRAPDDAKTSHVATLGTRRGRGATGPNENYWSGYPNLGNISKEYKGTDEPRQQANEDCSENNPNKQGNFYEKSVTDKL